MSLGKSIFDAKEAVMAADEAFDDARTRLMRRVEPDAESGCWVWVGHTSGGYGRIRVDGKRVQVHRYSFELHTKQRIAADLQLDHLCRNRLCVNPAHLEPVTPRENYLRGESVMAQQARRTHCLRGHALSGDNLRLRGRKRECRACALDAQRSRRADKRDQINAQKRDWYARTKAGV